MDANTKLEINLRSDVFENKTQMSDEAIANIGRDAETEHSDALAVLNAVLNGLLKQNGDIATEATNRLCNAIAHLENR